MSATATPTMTDRTELPHVLISGAKLGVLTAVWVVLYLVIWRYVPGTVGGVLDAVIVLLGGLSMALLPAEWTGARHPEGIGGAAGGGVCSAVVWCGIDIMVLRSGEAYPGTWEAIGGNRTWWYRPTWWQL